MKTQTRILDNRLYYTRKIDLHRKGKRSRTVRITPIVICLYLFIKLQRRHKSLKFFLGGEGKGAVLP